MGYPWNREEDIVPYFERVEVMELLVDTRAFSSREDIPSFVWVLCWIVVIDSIWAPYENAWRLRFTLRCTGEFPEGMPDILREWLLGNEYTISGLGQLRERLRPRGEA